MDFGQNINGFKVGQVRKLALRVMRDSSENTVRDQSVRLESHKATARRTMDQRLSSCLTQGYVEEVGQTQNSDAIEASVPDRRLVQVNYVKSQSPISPVRSDNGIGLNLDGT